MAHLWAPGRKECAVAALTALSLSLAGCGGPGEASTAIDPAARHLWDRVRTVKAKGAGEQTARVVLADERSRGGSGSNASESDSTSADTQQQIDQLRDQLQSIRDDLDRARQQSARAGQVDAGPPSSESASAAKPDAGQATAESASAANPDAGQPSSESATARVGTPTSLEDALNQIDDMRREIDRLQQQLSARGGTGAGGDCTEPKSSGGAGGPGGESPSSRGPSPSANELRRSARELCSTLGYMPEGSGGRGSSTSKSLKSSRKHASRSKARSKDVGGTGQFASPPACQPSSDTGQGGSGSSPSRGASENGRAARSSSDSGGASPPAPRIQSPPQRTTISGTVEAANADKVVLRSDSGDLQVVGISDQTRIHRGDEQVSPQDIEDGAKVRVRATRQGSRWSAFEVELEEK